jgi:HEAT repeat protein
MQKADELLTLDETALVKILQDPAAPVFQKNVACRRLAVIGTKAAVPALAAMLTDEKLAHYARFGLGPIPDPSADEALRAALAKVKGRLLVGVVNTIGQRKDERSLEALSRLLRDPDLEVAQAAAAAARNNGGPAAVKILREALGRIKGPARTAVAEAALVCAESLDRAGALAMYDTLARPDIPKPVRMAAMHSAFLTEAWSRPEK